jgi:hypothetical protein
MDHAIQIATSKVPGKVTECSLVGDTGRRGRVGEALARSLSRRRAFDEALGEDSCAIMPWTAVSFGK